jgi:hypothetical protein
MSTTAFQAAAGGGDRFTVVVDIAQGVKKNRLHANNGYITKLMIPRDAIQSLHRPLYVSKRGQRRKPGD